MHQPHADAHRNASSQNVRRFEALNTSESQTPRHRSRPLDEWFRISTAMASGNESEAQEVVRCHQHGYSIRRPQSRCAQLTFEPRGGNFAAGISKPERKARTFQGKRDLKGHIYNSGPSPPCLAFECDAQRCPLRNRNRFPMFLGAARRHSYRHPVDDDKL